MFNSFLIKLKSLKSGNIDNISISLYKNFWELVKISSKMITPTWYNDFNYELQYLRGAFSTTGFLGLNKKNIKIENNKYYFFRICTLNKELFSLFTSTLFRLKMEKSVFKIENIEFNILDIICDENKSKWAATMNENDIEALFSKNIFNDVIKIKIVSPMVFKIGDKFSCEFNSKLLYGNLLKKFKKYSFYDIDKNVLNELSKIKIILENSKVQKIFLNNGYILGKIGDLSIDMNNINQETKILANILLNFAFFSGIGYKTEIGYGQILL